MVFFEREEKTYYTFTFAWFINATLIIFIKRFDVELWYLNGGFSVDFVLSVLGRYRDFLCQHPGKTCNRWASARQSASAHGETINLIAAIGVGGVPSNSLDCRVIEECIGPLERVGSCKRQSSTPSVICHYKTKTSLCSTGCIHYYIRVPTILHHYYVIL